MATYEINLARNLVLSPTRRRILFRALILYIAFSGLGFVLLANRLARDLVAARERCRDLQVLEQKCLHDCGRQEENIVRCAHSMGYTMARYADTLEAMDSLLGRRIHVASILLGLVSPLPAEADLSSVEISAAKQEITFDVLVPEDQSSGDMTPPNLINSWERDPDIAREFTQITAVNRQRTMLNGRSVLISRFSAHLTGKGS